LLELKNIHVAYGQIPVVRGVSLNVDEGEIVSLLGPNGAGKTTLLYAISGLLQLQKGQIFLNNQRIDSLPSHRIVQYGLIQVPEGRKIFPSLTVTENLELGSFNRIAKKNRQKNFDFVYELFPILADRKNQPGGTLSGGEQQMLAIARGIMGEPKLLILDEPSLGLSPKIVTDVFKRISMINSQGVPILLVEQNVVNSLKISNRGYVMEEGKVLLSGNSKELLENPHTQECYLARKD
jgi:branched-chain amino acid transport system ATP-binding protein